MVRPLISSLITPLITPLITFNRALITFFGGPGIWALFRVLEEQLHS